MDDDWSIKIKDFIDIKFTENILQKSENDPSIKVINVIVKPATSKGDNYTSYMIRVTTDYVRSYGAIKRKEKKSFIVKVQPSNERQIDLLVESTFFSTEIMMMADTLVKMNEILGPGSKLNGRCLLTQKANPTLLVIEDLAPLGFRMANRQAGLDMNHSLLALRGLARFHASSVALSEKEPEQKKQYTLGMLDTRQPQVFRDFFTKQTSKLAGEIINWPELDARYSKKISRIADSIYERACEAAACRENEFNVINHGDYWVNNMLFKYDDNDRPVEHILVDFQLCNYTSPAFDLLYFFNSSVTEEILAKNEEALLEEYLNTLSKTMPKLGCRTTPPSMTELKRTIQDRAMIGMITSLTTLPVQISEKSEAREWDEIDGYLDCYKNPVYRKMLANRLPKFEKIGLLD